MNLNHISSVTILLVLFSVSGVKSATVTLSTSSEKGQLGNYSISLFCNYTFSSEELFLYMNFLRKRAVEATFIKIITFYEDNRANATYYNEASDLKGRTVLVNPLASKRSAMLQFDSIQCADEADYRCELQYAQLGIQNMTSSESKLVVTATPMFGNQSLLYTPSTNLAENQTVTFTCIGNVGREPQGTFSWYKYVLWQSTGSVITNGINLVSLTNAAGSCTYVRTENLNLNLNKEDNQMVIRCTVQQTTVTESGDGNIQTDHISVYYAPRINPIGRVPYLPTYSEGLALLTLTCNASSNPPSNYVWTLPDGTMQTGNQLSLASLTTNHTGTYTCMAYTGWGGQNYSANNSINITVVATTTPPPTTTTTTTRSSSTASVPKKPGTAAASGDNVAQADSTTGMIIGIVIGGVVVIIAIIIVIVCIKKRKKQEIEEPAEKPRNNRDLVFTGNRPDLVTSDEKWRNNQNNHMQNTSLNNSYDSSDSKVKADGQLTYVDLQFDDKPRSRKPIQLIDTGSTPYADIAMPRV